jgi:release factor glutamine methyltransferase
MQLNRQKTSFLTVAYALQQAKQQLKNINTSYLDSILLLQKATSLSKEQIIFNQRQLISVSQFNVFCNLITKRKNHQPIAYLLGYKEFFNLNFFVNKHTLIPRPDSEILVEKAIKYCQNNLPDKNHHWQVLDLCCGSGCLGISFLKNIVNSSLIACDINKNAVSMAKKNVKYHQLQKKSRSDLFDGLTKYFTFFDLIITNPPYIKTTEIKTLQPEVQNFEPFIALDGKENGLYFYQKIAQQAGNFLTSNGNLFTEIGYEQEKLIIDIFQQLPTWKYINSYKDLHNIVRVLQFKKI